MPKRKRFSILWSLKDDSEPNQHSLEVAAMPLSLPKLSLVVLVGPSGSGKSTFARKHFLVTEILSSDACRAISAASRWVSSPSASKASSASFAVSRCAASTSASSAFWPWKASRLILDCELKRR